MKNLRKGIVIASIITIEYKIVQRYIRSIIDDYEKEKNTYVYYYYVIKKWMLNQRKKIYLYDYLINKGIKNISIYGIGTLGKLFYDEIKDSDIKISYIVDISKKNRDFHGIPVISVEDIPCQEEVDAVIVTPVCNCIDIFNEIEKYNKNILKLSLEQLIYRE